MFNKLAKWAKDLYYTQQRKPNEPEITYQKQEDNIVERREIVFPDGEVLTLERNGNRKRIYWECRYDGILCEVSPRIIPDFSQWKPPMVELFLLLLKDRKNWNRRGTNSTVAYYHDLNKVFYSHKKLDITLEKTTELSTFGDTIYSISVWKAYGVELTTYEVGVVMSALEVYQMLPKMLRLKRIKDIRKERIEIEQRNADAKRIREYLENK